MTSSPTDWSRQRGSEPAILEATAGYEWHYTLLVLQTRSGDDDSVEGIIVININIIKFIIFRHFHIIFSQPMLTPNDHPLPTRPDSL